MVVSAQASQFVSGDHRELSRSRVLVSGVAGMAGLGLLALIAELGCRIVLDRAEDPLAAMQVAPAAILLEQSATTDEGAVTFAQEACAAFGGIDLAINIVRPGTPRSTSLAGLEAEMSDTLRGAFHVTRVIANRMRTTWCRGAIANVLVLQPGRNAAEQILAQMTRAALAGMTRTEAARWADDGIEITAIGPVVEHPEAGPFDCDPGLAELILTVGERAAPVAGLMLDPAQAGHWC